MSDRGGSLFSLFGDGSIFIGQIAIVPADGHFVLSHRDDIGVDGLRHYLPDQARELAIFDDAGVYRPLKTAPNLAHGWRIVVTDVDELERIIDAIYPARIAVLRASNSGELATTSWRETLERQSGIYRIAAAISDAESEQLIGNFCRSDGGCLRTVLWKRDSSGRVASTKLPSEKYDPAFDQTGQGRKCLPLLCQEPCNLLVAAARQLVKNKA